MSRHRRLGYGSTVAGRVVVDDPGVGAGLHSGIRLPPVFDREPLRKQRIYRKRTRGQEIQKSLHVSLLCPADKAYRIVLPSFLIKGVIAARAIGTRHRK